MLHFLFHCDNCIYEKKNRIALYWHCPCTHKTIRHPDLNHGSERNCHGNRDRHRLVVKDRVVENTERDEGENERCIHSMQE